MTCTGEVRDIKTGDVFIMVPTGDGKSEFRAVVRNMDAVVGGATKKIRIEYDRSNGTEIQRVTGADGAEVTAFSLKDEKGVYIEYRLLNAQNAEGERGLKWIAVSQRVEKATVDGVEDQTIYIKREVDVNGAIKQNFVDADGGEFDVGARLTLGESTYAKTKDGTWVDVLRKFGLLEVTGAGVTQKLHIQQRTDVDEGGNVTFSGFVFLDEQGNEVKPAAGARFVPETGVAWALTDSGNWVQTTQKMRLEVVRAGTSETQVVTRQMDVDDNGKLTAIKYLDSSGQDLATAGNLGLTLKIPSKDGTMEFVLTKQGKDGVMWLAAVETRDAKLGGETAQVTIKRDIV
jgi:hypothetical protein